MNRSSDQAPARSRARVVAFVRLGRPQFLVGGFLLYGLGAAVAVARGRGASLAPRPYLLGQAAITVVQLMTHYANDYFDFAADQANATPTRFSGGSRVLPSGVLSPRIAFGASIVLAALGLALAVAVAVCGGAGGSVAAGLLLLAQGLAWAYSAPPFVLHARGLGELNTAVVVTLLTPLVAFVLQVGAGGFIAGVHGLGDLAAMILPAILPLAALQFAMLLAIEFPDAAGDAAVGKRTLVVRLGAPGAAALYRAVLVATYGSIPLLVAAGLLPRVAALALALPAPLAAWQFLLLGAGVWRDPRGFEGLGFRAVALLVTSTAAELAAFVWLARHR
jgi:1,4-dihydroxy-2-naphthoate polyprenyltransferase